MENIMKHKTVNRNRFIATLITVILFIVSLACGVWQAVKGYAEDNSQLSAVEVNKKDEWIFTSNTPDESLYKMVTVTVTYQDTSSDPMLEDTYDLVFDGTTNTSGYVAATEEIVTFALNRSDGTVTVNVTPKPGATVADGVGTASKTCGMSEGEAVQNGIVAEFMKDSAPKVTSATPMYDSSLYDGVHIYITYNDGTQDRNAVTETTYTFSGSFFPEDLYDYLTNHNGEEYSRPLTVTYNSFTTTVVWEGIKFEEPDDINATRITEALDTQYARSPELNLNGLTVTFIYIDTIGETAVVVPVSVFKSYLTIKYFDSGNNEITSDIEKTGLTTKIKSINLTFKYKEWTFTGSWRNITINPLSIHVPNLPDTRETVLTWNSTATKPDGTATINIGKWDWDYTDFPDPVIKATVATPTDGDGYAPTGEVYASDVEGEYKLEVDFDKETSVVTVYFPKPEAYYLLTVELDPTGDFQWSNAPDHVKPNGAFILQIGVRVEKGKPEIEFSLSDADKEYVYGSGIDTGSVTATLDGEDMNEKHGITWTYDKLGSGAEAKNKYVKESKYHYYLKFYISYTSEEVNVAVPETDLRSDGMPKPVLDGGGYYYVVAYTYENFGYYQAISEPVSFKITQFEIDAQADDKTFARTEWGIDKFITENNAFPYNDDKYNENVFTVLSITANGQTIDASSPLYNANKYNVTLSIKASAFSKNYKFKDNISTLEFSIKTYLGSKFEFKSHSWVYGNIAQAYAVESVTLLDADTDGKLSDSDLKKYFAKWSDSSATTTNQSYIAADFTIEYLYGTTFDSALVGKPVTQSDLSKLEVGTYTVRLTAKAGTPLGTHTENAKTAAGQDVDYTLPVVEDTFNVNEEAIVKPTLSTDGEDDWSTDDGTIKTVYQYNNGAFSSESDPVFKFENWIMSTFKSNTTADGSSSIITVTVSYKKPYSTSTSIKTEYVFDKDFVADEENDTVKFNEQTGVFRLQEAGTYTITVSLNKNYTWQNDAEQDKSDNEPYSYYGKVARQTIELLQDSDITPANGVYSGVEQEKSINLGTDPLEITGLVMSKLYDGHAFIDDGHRFLADGRFYVTNAGKYTVSVDIKEPGETNKQANKDNYEWAEKVNGSEIGTLTLTYTLNQATLKVQWQAVVDDTTKTSSGTKDFSVFYFEFDGEATGEQKIPQATAFVDCAADRENLNIDSYIRYIYDESTQTYSQAVEGNIIKAIGKYVIIVEKFSGAAQPNYKLPTFATLDEALDVGTVFEIKAAGLPAPRYDEAGKVLGRDVILLEETYDGNVINLTKYIYNYDSAYKIGGEYRIKIEAFEAGDTSKSTPVGAKNAGTYTVVISISDNNFNWSESVQSYVFTLKINPRPIEIEWDETQEQTYGITRDYNKSGVAVPKFRIENICNNGENTVDGKSANDEVYVTLTFTDSQSGTHTYNTENGNGKIVLNAGIYTVAVTEPLSGAQSANYTVTGGANLTSAFTVKKSAVAVPTYAPVIVNNSVSGEHIISGDIGYDGIVTVTVDGVIPGKDKFGGDSWWTDETETITIINDTFDFLGGSVTFKYERAGIYTFTFKLQSGNYYWADADAEATNFDYDGTEYVYGTKAMLTVNRLEVTAPDIHDQRDQQWEQVTAIDFLTAVRTANQAFGEDLSYAITYVNLAEPGNTYSEWQGLDGNGKGLQGTYYAEIVLSAKSEVLDYVWVRNENDVSDGYNGSTYLRDYPDVLTYSKVGGNSMVVIRIYYTITLTQLKLDLAFRDEGYTFGDNGYVGDNGPTAGFVTSQKTVKKTVDGQEVEVQVTVAELKNDPSQSIVYLVGDSANSLGDITVEFENPTFKYATRDGRGGITVDETRVVELVNGLPWLPASYVVIGDLHFTKGSKDRDEDYQPLTKISCFFTVSQRELTIEWEVGSYTYNNSEQKPTAKITNKIFKLNENEGGTVKGDPIDISGITLSVVSADVNTYNLISAGTHKVKVDAIEGDEYGYFVLPAAAENPTDLPWLMEYDIAKKDVRVDADKQADNVYLENLPEFTFTVDKNEEGKTFVSGDGAEEALRIKVYDSQSKKVIYDDNSGLSDRTAAVGTYTVEVYWKDGDNCALANNYNFAGTFFTAEFVIVAREITVAWDKVNANSTYGQGVDLYAHLDSIRTTNGTGAPLGGKTEQEVVSFTAYADDAHTGAITLGSNTDAGTYYVKPYASDTANWIITFTDYSESDNSTWSNWTYVIKNAAITAVKDSFKTVEGTEETENGLVYDAAEHSIFAGAADGNYPKVTVVNGAETIWHFYEITESQFNSEDRSDSWDWTEMDATAPDIEIRDAGWHYFVVKIEAKNHDILYVYVSVYMKQATIYVQFNFTVMYGEDSPAAEGRQYQFDLDGSYSNIRNADSHWEITGFEGDDEGKFRTATAGADFYNLTGEAKYEVADYSKGDFTGAFPVDGYTINYIGDLACRNYKFVSKAGLLTITKIRLTVDAKQNLYTEYNDPDAADYIIVSTDMNGTAYKVTNPQSSYGNGEVYEPTFVGFTYENLFKVTSTAFTLKDNPTTNNVGSYPLVIEQLQNEYAKYFDIGGETAYFEIKAATLTDVNGVEGYAAKYDEQYHGLIVVYGEDDKRPTVDGNNNQVNDLVIKTASDGTEVVIWYYGTESILNGEAKYGTITEDEWNGATENSRLATRKAPAYIDRGTYYIYYKLTAANGELNNYIDEYGVVTVKIDIAVNELLSDGKFDFANGTAKESTSFADLADAWTYGYKVEQGYDPDDYSSDGQGIYEAVAKFKRANATESGKKTPLLYELRYSASGSGTADTASVLKSYKDYSDVKELFADVFENGDFNAGYYALRVYMKLNETDNFSFADVYFVFRVAKRNLIITAENTSVIYGAAKPEAGYFTPKYIGLVSNSPNADADSIEKAIGSIPQFNTAYNQGDTVGGGTGTGEYLGWYYIRRTSPVDNEFITNYIVEYKDAWLEVKQREITITIADQTSTYSQTAYEGTPGLKKLTFSLASGTIFGAESVSVFNNSNQNVLRLYTEALVKYNSATDTYGTTNDVKFDGDEIVGYTIYAVFYVAYGAGSSEAQMRQNPENNYVIKFSGCSMYEQGNGFEQQPENNGKVIDSGVNPETDKLHGNNAGKYIIEQASANATLMGVYRYIDGQRVQSYRTNSAVYSGAANYLEVLLDKKDSSESDLIIPFKYYKEGTSEEVAEVIDVGVYDAKGSSTNMNYTATDLNFSIVITEATLYLTANPSTVEHGTALSGNVAKDEAADGAKATGRFQGFTYTVRSATISATDHTPQLIQEVVNHYKAGTQDCAEVGYTLEGYTPKTNVGTAAYIVPSCEDDYDGNIAIIPERAPLTVEQRKVTVTIVGWDEEHKSDPSLHNEYATCVYKGNDNTLLSGAFGTQYKEHLSSFIYTDVQKTFGARFADEGKIDYEVLGITLKLPGTAASAGDYDISWEISGDTSTFTQNYSITVTNSESAKPQFHVQKKELTLSAYEATTSNGLHYGNKINLIVSDSTNSTGDLMYSVDGMLSGETFVSECLKSAYRVVFTVKAADGTVYTPWASGVGKYNVTVGIAKVSDDGTVEYVDYDKVFTNYKITKFEGTTLTISARVITASTENQIFGFNGVNYNGGLYGKSHEAEIEFALNIDANKDGEYAEKYAPTCTLSYNTKTLTNGGTTYQTATKAPTVVGDYEVYVKLTGGNYVFAEGATKTLAFSVTPLEITATQLKWSPDSITVAEDSTEEKVSTSIARYQSAYMDIAAFDYIRTGAASGVAVNKGSAAEIGTYYFDSDGLHITVKPTAIGRYTVRIQLKEAAMHNIQLKYGTDDRDYLDITFVVTNETVTMQVYFEGFEYGQQPEDPVVYINDSESPVANNLTIRYARIDEAKTTADLEQLCEDSQDSKGLLQIGDDVVIGSWTPTLNAMAGYYVLYVNYSYTGADDTIMATRYIVFNVRKQGVELPKGVKVDNLTYNGREQFIEATYDAYLMNSSIVGDSGRIVSREFVEGAYKVTFAVTDAGTYKIQFVLVNSNNYVWKETESDNVNVNGDTATYTLVVLTDEVKTVDSANPVIDLEAITKPYGVAINESYIEIVNAGYAGQITLYYMVKSGPTAPDIDDAGWLLYEKRPGKLGKGEYWIKATVEDVKLGTKNFLSKSVVAQFTVIPATVTVTVSGEMTYGDLLKDADVDLEFNGFVDDEGAAFIDEIIRRGGYSYKLVNDETVNGVGRYRIILVTNGDGTVKNMSAGDNYTIFAGEGVLIVNKRHITIAIERSSGYYAVEHKIGDLKYALAEDSTLADGDELSDLKIVLEIQDISGKKVAIDSDVGIYGIVIASYDDTNYEISWLRVSYQIMQLEIEIALELNYNADGNIVYNPDFNPDRDWLVKFDNENSKVITEGFNPDNMNIVERNLNLSLWYTGVTNAGVHYADGKAPTQAGTYTAQVMGASGNVTLMGMPSVQFTINKKTLDESLMVIESQTYTGSPLTPVITVKDNEYGSELYSATIQRYVNADTYDINVILTDRFNYQWTYAVDVATVKFTIEKATDMETTRLTIKGWQYGNYSAAVNSPSAAVKSGSTIYYEYSTDGGLTYSNVIPEAGSVGVYYVRVSVFESANYKAFKGEPVEFEITKYLLGVPTFASDDHTYTGSELIANISGFDSRYMAVMDNSDARTYMGASSIIAVTTNAGVYNIYIGIVDFANYGWRDGAGDEHGVLTFTWEIGKMKIALPTAGKNSFIVNGNEIIYIPDGFDESIMTIEKNVYSYGGNFVAVIRLLDTDNYEWITGEEAIEFKWHITGAEVLFYIILAVLLLLVLAGAAGIVTQVALDKREKRAAAAAMDEIESKDVLENGGGTADSGGADTGGAAEAQNAESRNTAVGGEK